MRSLVYCTLQQSAMKDGFRVSFGPSSLTMIACAANYNPCYKSFVKLNRLGLPNVSVIQSFNFYTVVIAAI